MRQLQYGTTVIDYVLDYAERRTLGVRVSPDGRVSVTAPPGTDLATIERKLLSKAAWIRRQRDYFLSFQPRTSERRYVSGETHLYLGKRYRLKVHQVDGEGEEGVRLERGYLHLRTAARPGPRPLAPAAAAFLRSLRPSAFSPLAGRPPARRPCLLLRPGSIENEVADQPLGELPPLRYDHPQLRAHQGLPRNVSST